MRRAERLEEAAARRLEGPAEPGRLGAALSNLRPRTVLEAYGLAVIAEIGRAHV